jgi:hypothetical protein
MAIGTDYIYWAHGVSDRVLYNATTFNHDAYFVDSAQIEFTDDSRWAQYLKPDVKDAVYSVNTLEYVAPPMTNLDSEYLDITPEWLAELTGFTNNGHQTGLMRTAVEQLFRGEADPLVGMRVANETPATYFNFEITDPSGLEAVLDLPPGHSLAETMLFDSAEAGYYPTLSIYEFEGAIEGTRSEWSVDTDDGSGRPHLMILELMTSEVAFDPASIINLPRRSWWTRFPHRGTSSSAPRLPSCSTATIRRSTSSSAGTTSRCSFTNSRSTVWRVVLTPLPVAERDPVLVEGTFDGPHRLVAGSPFGLDLGGVPEAPASTARLGKWTRRPSIVTVLTVPALTYALAADRLQVACAERGIEYRVHPSITSAVRSHARWLRAMGRAPEAPVR